MTRAASLSRVLVTGADGRLGRAVTADLQSRGVNVTGLSLSWSGPERPDRAIPGDATNEADVTSALDGVDAVVHLAALPHRDAGPPYAVYRTNTDATFNVLSSAGIRGVRRAVIASSINAFGVPMHSKERLPAYYPIDEQVPVDLDDWYSLSKRSDELTSEMAASHWGMTVVALRFPFLGLTDEVLEYASEDTHAQIREGWSYLDTRDAARAVWASLTAPLETGSYVVGLSAAETYRPERTSDLLDRFAPDVERRAYFDGRASLIDTSRARELLGFTPRYLADIPQLEPSSNEVLS